MCTGGCEGLGSGVLVCAPGGNNDGASRSQGAEESRTKTRSLAVCTPPRHPVPVFWVGGAKVYHRPIRTTGVPDVDHDCRGGAHTEARSQTIVKRWPADLYRRVQAVAEVQNSHPAPCSPAPTASTVAGGVTGAGGFGGVGGRTALASSVAPYMNLGSGFGGAGGIGLAARGGVDATCSARSELRKCRTPFVQNLMDLLTLSLSFLLACWR